MRSNRKRIEPPQFLSGWKDIANYLGKGVRTVQRYEWEFGLPVRRPAGKSRGAVVATKAELDGWVSASPIREAFYLTKSPTDSRHVAAADEIKMGVAEMVRLRDQMRALRLEMRASVNVLRHSIQNLSGELKQDGYRETASPAATRRLYADESELFDLLFADTPHRKAS